MEAKTVTPAQVWTQYLERMVRDPNAYFELPAIRSLEELERMDRAELMRLWQKLNERKIEATKSALAKEFLALVGAKKSGSAYYRDKNTHEMRQAFMALGKKRMYRYVFAIKRNRSAYFIVYVTEPVAKLPLSEFEEFLRAVREKYFYLSKTAHTTKEFVVTYKHVVAVVEKFRKEELLVLSHTHLLSLNEILVKKREKRNKPRISSYLVEKSIHAFFTHLFM